MKKNLKLASLIFVTIFVFSTFQGVGRVETLDIDSAAPQENSTLADVGFDDYDYRRKITISACWDAGTDFQINMILRDDVGSDSGNILYSGGNYIRSDWNDITFTGSDGATELDFWVESYTSYEAEIWVEVRETLFWDVDIYWCYGDSTAATSKSNGGETFLFFDDFNQDRETYTWTNYTTGTGSASCEISNGELHSTLSATTDGSKFGYELRSEKTWSTPSFAVHANARWTNLDDYRGYATFLNVGFLDSEDHHTAWAYQIYGDYKFHTQCIADANLLGKINPSDTGDTEGNMEVNYFIEGNDYDLRVAGEYSNQFVGTTPGSFDAPFRMRLVSVIQRRTTSPTYVDTYFDTVYVRKWVSSGQPVLHGGNVEPCSHIDMDVLILYDSGALGWYVNPPWGIPIDVEGAKLRMVEDVLKMNNFFEQYWSNIQWHADVDWMIIDNDGYTGTHTDTLDYFFGWQEENGWPANRYDISNSWNHVGMSSDGYQDVHGRHFDYLVMFGVAPYLAHGWTHRYQNAMFINMGPLALVGFRGWTNWITNPFLFGTWSIICHEMCHSYGISGNPHPTYGDLMDEVHLYYPASKSLAPENQEVIGPNLAEFYAYQDSGFVTEAEQNFGVNGQSKTVSGWNGYRVDTIGYNHYGYDFYAYEKQMYIADSTGTISGRGMFQYYDTDPETSPEHEDLKIYVFDSNHQLKAEQYILFGDGQGYWWWRSFSISGLTSGQAYYIAFGRYDHSSTEYSYKAQWVGVSINNRAAFT